jgi:pimeloyl-ACP methyl ester carboxylesterase
MRFDMGEDPKSKYASANGRRIHYLDWEEKGLRTMILLHGIGDNAHIWDHFAHEARSFFRIIAPDQRGHGQSEWPRPPAYSCDDYVADMEGFMDALALNDVILLGHSMGALHATRYAALHPERVSALVHVDIEACPPEWNKKYLSNLYKQLPDAYNTITDYVIEARKNSPYADEDLLNRIAALALDKGPDGRFRLQYDREVLYHFDRYDLRFCLKDIRCPSLMIRGEESRVMREDVARSMSRAIPDGHFCAVPRAAHPVHTDNPQAFKEIVFDFFKKQRLSPRR